MLDAPRAPNVRGAAAEALAWLYERQALGMKLGLRNERDLLSRLGDPHRAYATLHVGGTNGKGTTAVLLAAALGAAGVRTGLTVSPHLVAFGERVQVDGSPLPDDDLARLVAEVRPHADALPSPPTFFEVVTALAFLQFARRSVRAAVVEVGLGGRLDSTNVVDPEAVVLTNVGTDHADVLGPTVRDIAREKAGILKPGVPAVTGARGDALDVVEARARELACPLEVLGRDVHVERFDRGLGPQRLRLRTPRSDRTLTLALPGAAHAENAALALAALEHAALRRPDLAVPDDALRRAWASVRHPGRLELLEGSPRWLLDGAHNREALDRLLAFLDEVRPRRLVAVLGVLRDKPWPDMAARLAARADVLVCTRSRNARAADPEALAAAARAAPDAGEVRAADSLLDALAAARDAAHPGGLVLVTGSLFTVGEARAALLGEPDALEGLRVLQ